MITLLEAMEIVCDTVRDTKDVYPSGRCGWCGQRRDKKTLMRTGVNDDGPP